MSALQFPITNRDVMFLFRTGSMIIALWLGSFSFSAHGASKLFVGPNINITKSAANNAEEAIAINPLNSSNLFAIDTLAVVGRYSTNGGTTWQNSDLSALPASIGDVSVSWDQYGNLFLISMGTSAEVLVGMSINGGASFTFVAQSNATGNDQPTVTTGPSGTGQGTLWINWTDSAGELVINGALVSGLGVIGGFNSGQLVPGPGGDYGDVAVGPNGEVMVAYQDIASGEGPDTIKVNVDLDGTGPGTFGPVITAANINVGGLAFITPQPQRSVDSEIGLAWDRSGGAHNGRVYLMYTDRTNTTTDDTDIFVRYSDNKGTAWSAPVRVNDDPVGNGKSQFLPKIALDQTSGNIAVVWYDCRNSPNNTTAEFWGTVSTDGGVTFQPNSKISTGASTALVGAVAGFDFGDYTGLAYNNGLIYPCWADNSNSTGDNPAGANSSFDMYTAKVTITTKPTIAGITPTNLIVLMNQPATFTASVSGTPPLTFRWLHNGSPVPALSNVFFLPSAQPADSGNYSFIVTNGFGAATSSIVTLTVIPTVPLPFALNDSLTWAVDPVSPWYGQTSISHDGVASAQTFFLADASQTRLRTTVTGPGTLNFWWKVSSQTNADILSFALDGTNAYQISGEAGWELHTNFLKSGSHTLQWTYAKDASGSAGQDAAWVDQVTYAAGGTAPFILSPPADVASFGTPATFSVTADGTPDLAYQWLFNNALIPGATGISYGLAAPLTPDAGAYSVRITNLYGSITSSAAILTVVPMLLRGDGSLGQLDVSASASNAVAVSAAGFHTLILRGDGIVLACGNDADGESTVPGDLTNVVDIAAGGYHSLALQADQRLKCWGADYYGQSSPPGDATNVIAIAAGTWHSVALLGNRTVRAWGDDTWGQSTVPAGLNNVVAIAASGNHSLALRANGTVVAWGQNEDAQGNFVGQSTPPDLANVVGIGTGEYHSLALLANGTLVAWGDNSQGQCDVPAGLSNVVAVVGGGAHTLALKADGTVSAWGSDLQGQSDFPAGLSNVVLLAAGTSHSLALFTTRPAAPTLLYPQRGKNRFATVVQTYAGRNYALEATASLKPPAWTAINTNRGNGVLQFMIDAGATGTPRFYRARQW